VAVTVAVLADERGRHTGTVRHDLLADSVIKNLVKDGDGKGSVPRRITILSVYYL
jgi:hypothetical protein